MMQPLRSSLREERKYTVFWVVFLAACFMLVIDKLSGDQWVTIVGAVFAAYMAGNVGEHFAKRKEAG